MEAAIQRADKNHDGLVDVEELKVILHEAATAAKAEEHEAATPAKAEEVLPAIPK